MYNGANLQWELQNAARGQHAYAASLWGTDRGFALGALVLGAALRRSGTQKDLVLLHTQDVPKSTLEILGLVWKLKVVDFIDANAGLFNKKGDRFDGVFTKLNVLRLVGYEKVLMLDLDLAILQCPDTLFDLDAPAAMHRRIAGGDHGASIDGRSFFSGATPDNDFPGFEPWSQCGGINAGVMLLEPNLEVCERLIQEVTLPAHPERVAGSGPEQDFLSRAFAPSWTNIDVRWNYQLHRVFHAFEAWLHQWVTDQNSFTDQDAEVETALPYRMVLDEKRPLHHPFQRASQHLEVCLCPP